MKLANFYTFPSVFLRVGQTEQPQVILLWIDIHQCLQRQKEVEAWLRLMNSFAREVQASWSKYSTELHSRNAKATEPVLLWLETWP